MQVQPKFVSVEAWAGISGLGRTTIYALLRRGELRAVKQGRRTLIDVDAGLAFLHARPALVLR